MREVSGLSLSRQCYLAEILALEADQGCAKQSEIAARIRVSRSSVTAALRSLAESGMVLYEPYGAVTLTPKGRRMAETILARRSIIRDYLIMALNIDEGSASDAACSMQHSVPDIVLEGFSARLRSGVNRISPL